MRVSRSVVANSRQKYPRSVDQPARFRPHRLKIHMKIRVNASIKCNLRYFGYILIQGFAERLSAHAASQRRGITMLSVSCDITGIALDPSQQPVYMQRWFSKIAEGIGGTRQILVTENENVVGRLTVVFGRNKIGMKQAYNLPWARFQSPIVCETVSQNERAEIIRRLIRQLPTDVSYNLTLANEFDYRVFLSEGFEPYPEDNYIVTPDQAQRLCQSFSTMTKRHIRQAQEQLVVSTTTPRAFINIYAADLRRRHRRSYAPLEIAREILEEGLLRGQARIFTANRRSTGEVDAAIACLWDEANYYYWMTTRRIHVEGESYPHQGAVKLLLWSAIQDAAGRNLTFDFDGVPSDGASRLYEGMGAQKSKRYRVKRNTRFERYFGRYRLLVKTLMTPAFRSLISLRNDELTPSELSR